MTKSERQGAFQGLFKRVWKQRAPRIRPSRLAVSLAKTPLGTAFDVLYEARRSEVRRGNVAFQRGVDNHRALL